MVILGVLALGVSLGLRRRPRRTPAATLFADGTRFDDGTTWIDGEATAATLFADGTSWKDER